jgi:hypothetical protein
MKRFLVVFLIPALAFLQTVLAGENEEPATAKEALQALNDYIGQWKGNGNPTAKNVQGWKETVSWSWRFKGRESWLVMEIKDGKYFKSGEVRYLKDKKRYQLTAIDKNDKKLVFQGELNKGRLTLQRKDEATRETQQVQMNMAGGGVRFVYTYWTKPENRTLFNKNFQVDFTRKGESFGVAEKKVECIVTGGLGTIAVMHKGVTYYVCCSGCRDAFNEDPERFIKEYNEKKKAK